LRCGFYFAGDELDFELNIPEEDTMSAFKRSSFAVAVMVALIFGLMSPAAFADQYTEREKPTGGMMMWDVLVMRPIGIVGTAVGSVIWLVSYPFAALGGNTDESTEALVQQPFEWTFQRPLGEF
jgi:predicted membrane protein